MLVKRGGVLILAGVREQPKGLLARSGLLERLGPRNVVATLDEAWLSGREA
jgi:hypothetical protein